MEGQQWGRQRALEGRYAHVPNHPSDGSHLRNTLVLGCCVPTSLDEVVAAQCRMLTLCSWWVGGEQVLAELLALDLAPTSLPQAPPNLGPQGLAVGLLDDLAVWLQVVYSQECLPQAVVLAESV